MNLANENTGINAGTHSPSETALFETEGTSREFRSGHFRASIVFDTHGAFD
jgi:hypothetical protein